MEILTNDKVPECHTDALWAILSILQSCKEAAPKVLEHAALKKIIGYISPSKDSEFYERAAEVVTSIVKHSKTYSEHLVKNGILEAFKPMLASKSLELQTYMRVMWCLTIMVIGNNDIARNLVTLNMIPDIVRLMRVNGIQNSALWCIVTSIIASDPSELKSLRSKVKTSDIQKALDPAVAMSPSTSGKLTELTYKALDKLNGQ